MENALKKTYSTYTKGEPTRCLVKSASGDTALQKEYVQNKKEHQKNSDQECPEQDILNVLWFNLVKLRSMNSDLSIWSK